MSDAPSQPSVSDVRRSQALLHPADRRLLVIVGSDDDDSVCWSHAGTCTPSTPCDVACSGEQHGDPGGPVHCDLCLRELRAMSDDARSQS